MEPSEIGITHDDLLPLEKAVTGESVEWGGGSFVFGPIKKGTNLNKDRC